MLSDSIISDETCSESDPLVFRNPDGTYTHVVKDRKILHDKAEKKSKRDRGNEGGGSSSALSEAGSGINSELEYEFEQDDEQEFLLELMTTPQDVNDLIAIFDKHRKIFLFLLVVQICLEIYWIVIASVQQDERVSDLQEFYRNVERDNLVTVYWVVMGIELFVMVFYVPFGIYGTGW
eukprot:CAMPEP_0115015208 /NCGR_PEP_ID=MMETSP0216-20121206/26605_1 /TAXON_ID=223996 /ORGANISM="Protocruzia adherens, Strain Boccale" /LENGTH=177 /DNA_ID=CAMNT_0002385231 /DNA_START=193 /DNA_END=723 /DNA_ORIENTATION=+